MAEDHRDLPFKGEYAKSGRSSCKACKSSISQNSLRLAVMVQSPVFDGKIPNWFHYACFWKRAKVEDPHLIHGFDSLRWEDQQKIKDKIGGGGSGDAADGGSSDGPEKEFSVEYAKSGRSTCRMCDLKIEKDMMRISKKDYESQRAKMYGPQDLWHHVDCFVENRVELEFGNDLNVEKVKGFSKLEKEDKAELVKKLGKGTTGKKRKNEKEEAVAKKPKIEQTEEEKILQEQSKLIWEFKDKLKKEVANEAMKVLLELNDQEIPSGESKLIDAVSDVMAFGALKRCPECKLGQLVYSSVGYKCTGNVTEWTKCMYVTKNPERKTFKVPKDYHDVDFLKTYKYVKRERAFPAAAVLASASLEMDTVDSAGSSSGKPLEGMTFLVSAKTQKPKGDLEKEITKLGGFVVSKIRSDLAAVISSEAELKKKPKLIKDAEKANIHVIKEDFLEDVQKGGAVLMIQKHSIAPWGGDVSSRVQSTQFTKSGSSKAKSRDEKLFTKNLPATMKMTVKGGSAVDPDSGLSDSAHVIEDGKECVYNAVLGMVDVVRGTNSYYKIQALESDTKNTCWIFRAWGRVGTTIGGNKVERCGSRKTAIDSFCQLYAEKTGNEWSNRKDFKKFPNKFYPLEIDYGQDDEEVKKLSVKDSHSKLPKSVQDLVCLIFDVEGMKKTMMEFEIDLKKMPLGKLSKRQLESAYSVLTELTKLKSEGGTQTQFLDATNRFYTLVPHDFGLKKPPLLDSEEIIKAKTEMLDNLLEIEVAYNLLKSGDSGEDPIDSHYKKLKTEIKPLDKKDETFQRLVEYVKNTHASTHNQYELDVEEIFEIVREGEGTRYAPFKQLHNKQLLWHGSRTTNFAGILSQGLRIAPPEAPVTGYMFGKGVYFADMVSKSANYCRTSKSDPTGIMILCEVALGNMYERLGADYITKLPKGKHSTKGCGRTAPDPNGKYVTPDGVEIPMGKGVDSKINNSSLLYNEFIVYDVAQINMKYLFKMNFQFKW